MTPRAVALVEGASDAAVLEGLARRRGTPPGTTRIVVLHGYTNLGSALRALAPAAPERVSVLCDAGAAAYCRRVAGPSVPVRVCDADLEDELLRALGPDRVHALLDAHGELAALHALARQPGRRDRGEVENLRRFLSARSGRKVRWGALLAGALDPGAPPDPLARVLDDVGL
ncbi:hypothetical protein [Pseudonocardia sp. ICBG1293]|uniref:hypothetical protein n=1 Tax=Pseudonocardia sp. ICBG1293 TaxID=2844382 RepID=UPI001CCE5022|nr:hypothetical protein [Pseudonocardia sp. ICBG1293]